MPTNELSDALNPYASQARRASAINDYPSQNQVYSYPSVAQQPQQSPLNQSNHPNVVVQQHVQHVSGLHSAVVQAAPPPPPPVVRQRQGPPAVLAELFRIVTATQTAQEAEIKRRQAWEKEQEAKAVQDKADMEKKMLDLHTEITTLRSKLDILSNPPQPTNTFIHNTPQSTSSTNLVHMNTNNQTVSPISPVPQPSYFEQPTFIQGSSNSSLASAAHMNSNRLSDGAFSATQSHSPSQIGPLQLVATQTTPHPITPGPSPHLMFVETSRSPSASSIPSKRRRKRSQSPSSDDGNSSSSSSSSAASRTRKRTSHHDTRCYTIKHAMRLHVLRMMAIERDNELPDSHEEGTSLGPSEAVRFVWDKTTKQSVHNARMKTRVLEDIKENKRLYKHVDRKEFANKVLDSTFEQYFTTLRQKFKSQRDTLVAEHLKKREDGKARKARHISRRKTKLSARSEARNKIPTFEHVTFDGALQLDCMSSEESDYEGDPNSAEPSPIFRTHGYAWRSTRLLRFYSTLDDEDKSQAASRPKRGLGKKERQIGPNKKEFVLPPPGIATWMISRRWYKASLSTHKDLPQVLDKLIVDPDGFNWDHFHDLGNESIDEDEVNAQLQREQQFQIEMQRQQQRQQQQQQQQQQWQQQMQMQQMQQMHQQQSYNPHIHNLNMAMSHPVYDPIANAYNMNFNI